MSVFIKASFCKKQNLLNIVLVLEQQQEASTVAHQYLGAWSRRAPSWRPNEAIQQDITFTKVYTQAFQIKRTSTEHSI